MRLKLILLSVVLAVAMFVYDCRSIPVTGAFSFGKFSGLALYRRSAHPSRVAVFISGDGGWHSDLAHVATDLSKLDCLVIGVDISRYLETLKSDASPCVDLSSDFQAMIRAVEERLGYPQPIPAIVIGHSAGASMAYGILMQGSRGAFRGGISLGFSPGYSSPKPFCVRPGLISDWNQRSGEYDLESGGHPPVPWVAIHGTADSVCPYRDAVDFIKKTHGARFVTLPGLDHSITAAPMISALEKAFLEIAS